MLGLVFCHGWSSTPAYWNRLKNCFPGHPMLSWNLGYLGELSKPLPHTGEWIAIGHSIGFQKLLQSDFPFKGFIAIQGFTSFLGYDHQRKILREKILNKMIADFEKSPIEVIKRFQKFSGFPSEELPPWNLHRLREDLSELKAQFVEKKPLLVLGSHDDAIVPLELLKDNFPNCLMKCSEQGKHGLGFLEVSWCAQQISSFIYAQK